VDTTSVRLDQDEADDPLAVVRAFYHWIEHERGQSSPIESDDFRAYFRGIAEARYVIRKVLRIADEQAKRASLEPLEHQALIQIFGSPGQQRVSDLAERLDIAPAFASRIVKGLEHRELVVRSPSPHDKRSTYVTATDKARELLGSIDLSVSRHVAHFHQELTDAERAVALGIFAFYLGASRVSDLEALLNLTQR
jgi:DNA-binding MarR family transcriptional regulator